MCPRRAPAYDHINRRIDTLQHAALMRKILVLKCRRCPHRRTIDAVVVWWRWRHRGEDTLRAAERRFSCSKCRAADPPTVVRPLITVSDGPAENWGWSYPPDREWKRVISRFRS